MNTTPLGRAALRAEAPGRTLPADTDCVTGKEHVAAYLEPLAAGAPLAGCLRANTQVLAVGRRGFLKNGGVGDARRGQQPFRLLVREGKNPERVEEADVVLDCTGTYGQHRWLGDGGIPAVGETAAALYMAYHLEDILGERRAHYAGKTILLVGGGYSAATTACNLVSLAESDQGTWTIWLARCPGTQPLRRLANDPLRERDRLAVRANNLATRTDGNLEFHPQSVVEAVECAGPDKGFKVTARVAGKPRAWEVDRVIANVGYTPDSQLYRELQVHECYATLGPVHLGAALLKHAGGDGLGMPSPGANALRHPEPNFYVLGAKSYGRSAQFLLRAGFEQVREVFTLIAGRADLDLYRNAK